jgi:hypothetical protein
MDAHAVLQSGGSDPSLAESNAEVSSLVRLLLELPILPVAGLMEPDVEIEIG